MTRIRGDARSALDAGITGAGRVYVNGRRVNAWHPSVDLLAAVCNEAAGASR